VVISQGDIWWANLPDPAGSGPAFRRPVLVVQGDPFNRSRIATVLCISLISNPKWADVPGNVFLDARRTGLPKDSVANVSQVFVVDRSLPTEWGRQLVSMRETGEKDSMHFLTPLSKKLSNQMVATVAVVATKISWT
jgi:mRNA interferase MazF